MFLSIFNHFPYCSLGVIIQCNKIVNIGFLFLFSGASLFAMDVGSSSQSEKELVGETFFSVTFKEGSSDEQVVGRYYDSRNDLIFMKKNDKNYGIVKRDLDESKNWFFVVTYDEDPRCYCYRSGPKGCEAYVFNGDNTMSNKKNLVGRYKIYSKAFQATENR